MTFTHYIGVDYSSQERKQKTWVAIGRRTFMGYELQRLEAIGREALPDLLLEFASHRVLIGLDFPFSWPVGFITHLLGEAPRSWQALVRAVDEEWSPSKLKRKRSSYVNRKGPALRLTDTYLGTTSPLQDTYPDLWNMVQSGMPILSKRPQTYRVLPFERLEPSHSSIVEVAPEVTLQKMGIPHTQYHGESDVPLERRAEILRQLRLSNLVALDTADPLYKLALESDDALDAIICALTGTFFSADASTSGITLAMPSPNEMRRVSLEGWIYAPTQV